MRLTEPRAIFTRYAVAWTYLGIFVLVNVVYAALSGADQAAVANWASTSVHNLTHHPVGSLVSSAFIPQDSFWPWPPLIILTMLGAERALGHGRIIAVCVAGQVIGTLLSEGIVAYRVDHGLLPGAERFLLDIGPSYVVVSAAAAAVLLGSWAARTTAAVSLTLLIVVGSLCSGITRLDVAAVGHTTAIAVGVVAAGLIAWRHRRQLADQVRGRLAGGITGHGLAAPGGPAAAGRVPESAERPDEESDRPVGPQR
jgi:hypothetical protein